MLAPYLDEIELVLFESSYDSLPSKDEIKTLSLLANEFRISYNIHLPTDISLSDPDPLMQHHVLETLKCIIDLTSPLFPTTYTLHLSYNKTSVEKENVKKWQELIYKSMEKLLALGIDSKTISIETLQYPFEWIEKIITDLNLSVCIDIGHLIKYGFGLETVFNKYSELTPIIHLHGVENRHDHISLDRLSKKQIKPIMTLLKGFTGVVSLEVFSYENLNASLVFLEKYWQRIVPIIKPPAMSVI